MLWMIVLGLPVALAVWLYTFMRWRRGVELMLLYVPFAGMVALWLAPNKAGLLIKDFVFVFPVYFAALPLLLRQPRAAPVPPVIAGGLALLALMVLLQAFNPNLSNVAMAAIGAKVWLFYIPMMLVGALYVGRDGDLTRLARLMTAVALIPCAVGLLQFALAATIGYERAIELFYGQSAKGATQGFGAFELGGLLYRIPATFTYVSQYSGFTLASLVPCYMVMRHDPAYGWRVFGRVMMIVLIVAGLLSGARANFLFIPLLLALFYVLDGRISGALGGVVLFPALALAVSFVAGLDPLAVLGITSTLVQHYGATLVLPDLITTLNDFPLGKGTGMNTGPARYALPNAGEGLVVMYEGFYSKTITELGWPGLLVVAVLFTAFAIYGVAVHLRLTDRRLRGCSAALVAFIVVIIIHSFKGWQIDLDPINVYFWLFLGILFKLPALEAMPVAGRAWWAVRRHASGRPEAPSLR